MENGVPQRHDGMAGASCHEFESFLDRQGLMRRMRDPFAQPDEGDDQQYLRGRHGCLHELNRREVQAKCQCNRSAENGRDAENRYIAHNHSDRHAQRKPIRRDALTQKAEQWFKDPSAQPVFHGVFQRFRADRMADASWSGRNFRSCTST